MRAGTLVTLGLGLAAAPAAAQVARPAAADPGVAFPQFAGEINMGLYGIGTAGATDPRRRGTTTFLFGEVAAGLHLDPRFSIQGLVHVEPVGEVEPNGGLTGFRYQAAYLEALYADWRPTDTLGLYAGKFSAPFGRGHHDFPGILPLIRAHEVYLVGESLGFGATWTFLSDPRFGEHDLSAAAFTLDTTFLSNTAFTRKRCCAEGFERYARNTRAQGGPGNTGQLDNVALALDGDGISWLPNFSYHLALVSRGPGRDGTAREWGYAGGVRYEHRWSHTTRTLFFAEYVEFRNAGGRPLEAGPERIGPDGEELESLDVPVSERRRFTTIGAWTSHGRWRATVAWQRDQRKRSINTIPTESFLEFSVGREIGWGFSVDLGYQYARYARDDGTRGQSNTVLGVLRWQGGL